MTGFIPASLQFGVADENLDPREAECIEDLFELFSSASESILESGQLDADESAQDVVHTLTSIARAGVLPLNAGELVGAVIAGQAEPTEFAGLFMKTSVHPIEAHLRVSGLDASVVSLTDGDLKIIGFLDMVEPPREDGGEGNHDYLCDLIECMVVQAELGHGLLEGLSEILIATENSAPVWFDAESLDDLTSKQMDWAQEENQLMTVDGPQPVNIFRAPEPDVISSIAASGILIDTILEGRPYPDDSESTPLQRSYVYGFCDKKTLDALTEGLRYEPWVVLHGKASEACNAQVSVAQIYDRATGVGHTPEDAMLYRTTYRKLRDDLRGAWWVCVIDPVWGRADSRFWESISEAARGRFEPDRNRIGAQ